MLPTLNSKRKREDLSSKSQNEDDKVLSPKKRTKQQRLAIQQHQEVMEESQNDLNDLNVGPFHCSYEGCSKVYMEQKTLLDHKKRT